jgi:hypothetical protein
MPALPGRNGSFSESDPEKIDNKDIARELSLKLRTIENYVS